MTRLVNVEARKPRILYIEGEPRWEYKFIRRALRRLPTNIELVTHAAHHPEQDLPPGHPRPPEQHELEDGFPSKAEDLFAYQGLIIGSVEANYFTPTQQQLIRDFVDRRGGGLLFMGGRATLSDGGYPSSPLADLVPTKLPDAQRHVPPRFHRPGTDRRGRAERASAGWMTTPRATPSAGRRCRRWPTTRRSATPSPAPPCCWYPRPRASARLPLLVTENYGRGRTVLFATEGSWRWKMWLPHDDKTHATFWQQILPLPGDRYARPGDCHDAQAGALR